MKQSIPRLIKVTFTNRFPETFVDSLLENNFLSLSSSTYRKEERRVIYVKPIPKGYPVLVEQLETWKQEGRLSYEEELE